MIKSVARKFAYRPRNPLPFKDGRLKVLIAPPLPNKWYAIAGLEGALSLGFLYTMTKFPGLYAAGFGGFAAFTAYDLVTRFKHAQSQILSIDLLENGMELEIFKNFSK